MDFPLCTITLLMLLVPTIAVTESLKEWDFGALREAIAKFLQLCFWLKIWNLLGTILSFYMP